MRDVVLSGCGAITSRGDFVLHDDGGTARFTPTSSFQIEDFALEKYLDSQKTYLDRCSALALAGCALALRDAGVAWPVNEERFGITLGTHLGCVETMKKFWDVAVEKGARLANPLLFSHSYFNTPISLCAIEFGLKGYHSTFCAEKYSGLEAVRAAYDAIRLSHADVMLCGGVEAVTPTREAVTSNEQIGEASVFFVVEEKGHALERGARFREIEGGFFELSPESTFTELFGNCGGAQSILALAMKFAVAAGA
jgi:3-oxoacyl-[acyl-carrier-protein] synthase II